MPDIVRKSTKATTDKIFIPDSTQSNPEEVSGIFASPVYIAGSTTTASNVTIVSSSLDYSTESAQIVGNTSLASINAKLPSLTAGNRLPVDIGGNGSITITSGNITVANEVEVRNDIGNPVPVNTQLLQPLTNSELRATPIPASVSSLPLPTGAATSNNQATIINSIGGVLSNQLVEISALSSIDVKLPSLTGDNRIPVDINSATPLSTSITNDLPQIILDAINNSSGTFLIDGLVTEIVTALQSSLSVPVKKITSYEFYNVALTVGVYSTLPNQAATQVFIENQSTTSAARIRKVGGTNYITLNPGYGREFFVLSNLNELEALGDTANLTIEIETRN